MNFRKTNDSIVDLFQKFEIEKLVQTKNFNVHTYKLDTCLSGSEISISFPGYKTRISGSKIIYDFRVNLMKEGITTSLSHSNIIVDILNKISNTNIDVKKFEDLIKLSSIENDFDFNNPIDYIPTKPKSDLIESVSSIHRKLGKTFNTNGNLFDLDLEELFKSLLYIVLQEDINYPISKGYLGRKMCYSRYIETFNLNKGSLSLDNLISRTLSHTRPINCNHVDYGFLEFIK
jgi:hypothetical protein